MEVMKERERESQVKSAHEMTVTFVIRVLPRLTRRALDPFSILPLSLLFFVICNMWAIIYLGRLLAGPSLTVSGRPHRAHSPTACCPRPAASGPGN